MSKEDIIIENTNATMSMENMPLLQEDKDRIRECLDRKVSFQDAIDKLVKQYTHKLVN